MISTRANDWLNSSYGLMEGMKLAFANPYSPENADGCINLGSAENELMLDEIKRKFTEASMEAMTSFSVNDIRYGDFSGLMELRQEIADFLNRGLKLSEPIQWEDMVLTNGCGSAIESLFHVLCDRGDGVLVPSPYYGGFDMDLERRAGVKIVPIPLVFPYDLTKDQLEKAFNDSAVPVKVMLFMNPNNPMGIIYPEATVRMLIEFCREKQIHFVSDEIYAFSVFVDNKPLVSALKLLPEYSDMKELVHFLWGFSKDFCMNGIRMGVFVSKSATVVKGLQEISYFTGTASVTQRLLYNMMKDHEFCDSFVQINKQRLRENYDLVLQMIQEFNKQQNGKHVKILDADGGIFLWVYFGDFFEKTEAAEYEIFKKLIENGVYIAPGRLAFHSNEIGWFRIVFTAEKQKLSLAMKRIFKTLE